MTAAKENGAVYLGRSGRPPLRISGALVVRRRVAAEGRGVTMQADAELWRCAPDGWAVALRMTLDAVEKADAVRAATREEAARLAARAAESALRRAESAPPVSLAAAAEVACRGYARAALARDVARRLHAVLADVGSEAEALAAGA